MSLCRTMGESTLLNKRQRHTGIASGVTVSRIQTHGSLHLKTILCNYPKGSEVILQEKINSSVLLVLPFVFRLDHPKMGKSGVFAALLDTSIQKSSHTVCAKILTPACCWYFHKQALQEMVFTLTGRALNISSQKSNVSMKFLNFVQFDCSNILACEFAVMQSDNDNKCFL
ncbi:hypothetical protein AMECASPLE_037518 [Ameca splendens]|uniref:Uncharacterized protein n=1 Tax=Ameca splendens TaxID=208324 RepID=A0ABV0YJ37_9TELE